MKIGNIVETNSKGQIVIPKEVRDNLKIAIGTPLNVVIRGGGIYIYPVEEVLTKEEQNNTNKLLEVLKRTQGAWSNEDWEEFDRQERSRKKIELKAVKRNKQAW